MSSVVDWEMMYFIYFIFAMILLGIIRKGFEVLGLSSREITTIFFLSLILSFIYIPITVINGAILSISIGGAIIPLAITWRLLKSKRVRAYELLPIFVIATITSYLTTEVTDIGIVSYFPLYLIPPFLTGFFAYFSATNSGKPVPPLAYSAQTLGAILGADLLHLPEILSLKLPEGANLVIGGAGVFDMIYLSGLFAALFSIGAARALKRREIEFEGFSLKTRDITRTASTFIDYEKELERRILGK